MATKEEVIGVLRKCYDPEIPINIYDLGLVYNIDLKPDEGKVDVKMTLTAPGCPASAYIHQEDARDDVRDGKEAVRLGHLNHPVRATLPQVANLDILSAASRNP